MPDYPHITIEGEPLYVLTNQGCEDTGYWAHEQFEQLGLEYGEDYPLTDEEANLIACHNVMTLLGGDLMFGYSALFQNKKWAMPTIEYYLGDPRQQVASASATIAEDAERERKAIQELVATYQGRASYEQGGLEDRITVLILVPLQTLQEAFGHWNAWKRYLERGLGIQAEA